MTKNIVCARTCVYNVNYHIVWSTKYRRKVLTPVIEEFLKAQFHEIAREKGFEIALAEVGEEDHVHVFASAHPKVAPSYIVKMLKGITGRRLFLQFPEIKHQLWNPGYYIETIGSISEDAVKKYIENQKMRR